MTRKIKYGVSIALIIVLLLSMTVKFFDVVFHHHEHFHCNAKHEKHFHVYHYDKCPILTYEFSFFLFDKPLRVARKYDFGIRQIETYNSKFYKLSSKFSFLLRAPPYITKY